MCPKPGCKSSSLYTGNADHSRKTRRLGNVGKRSNKSDNYLYFIDTSTSPQSLNNPIRDLIIDTPWVMSINSNPHNKFINLNLLVNDVPVTGTIDSGAQISVITSDLAESCKMKISHDTLSYITADGNRTSSLGTAKGVLAFTLNSS
ncbi:hypothetical protein GEMRC1_009823 [Eukaryota sp. GEM-RC1]